jgi:tripartite-type tricarboxylate transporter receptor subunit TctC
MWKREMTIHSIHWRCRIRPALIMLSLLAGIGQVTAEPFPSKPIRFVVPTGVSTPPDIISRVVATALSETEGWRTIVENRPGVISIGAADVLKQSADGYSVLVGGVPVTAAPALLPNLDFDLGKDFAPVIKLSVSYNMLVVNPSVPAKSVADLVALLKNQPDELTFSSTGFGTPAHLIGEMFKLRTGVRATHVPYQQMPQAIGDLLNGTNQYQFIAMLPVIDLVNSGKLRGLAVTGPKRVSILKDVPAIVEEGFPDLVVEDWVGLSVKSGTPDDVITRLNQAVNKALATPTVRDTFAKIGAEPAGGTPPEYGDLFKFQIAHWAKIVNDSGIKVQK